MAIKFKLETITPKKAEEMLAKMGGNRPLAHHQVNSLVKAMSNGTWDPENGECIRFNTAGTLVDGQHRLVAVIRLGEPVKMMVARGVSDNTFETIDTGKRRNLGDVLAIEGYKAYNHLSTAIRTYHALVPPFQYQNVTNKQGLEIIRKHPKMVKSLAYVLQPGDKGRTAYAHLVGQGRLGGFHYAATRIADSDVGTADWFIDSLLTGKGARRGSPVYEYRRHLVELRDEHHSLSRAHALILLVKTWNAWRTDAKVNLKPGSEDSLEII